MPEIRSLTREKPVTVTLEHDGDALTFSFDANKVTPRWMATTQEGLEAQDTLSISQALASVFIDWDVQDEGQPFPPSADNIALLPFPIVVALFGQVCEKSSPTDAEGNASPPSANAPPSASSETSASSPNGSAGSTSPQPSESLSKT